MTYNDKTILVHATACIAGVNKGDIITVKTSGYRRGRILTVNGKPYSELKTGFDNHEWSLPLLDGEAWAIVTDNPKKAESEYTNGAVLVFGNSSNNSQYIGKYGGKNDKGYYLSNYYCKLDSLTEKSELFGGVDFAKVVRMPTDHEYKKYIKALDLKLGTTPKFKFEKYNMGDVVILTSKHAPGKKYIGRIVRMTNETIFCKPWSGFDKEQLDKSLQTHEGAFDNIVDSACIRDFNKFEALEVHATPVFDKTAIHEQIHAIEREDPKSLVDKMNPLQEAWNKALYNPCAEIRINPLTPMECIPRGEKHQKPVILNKTKKKKHYLTIVKQ